MGYGGRLCSPGWRWGNFAPMTKAPETPPVTVPELQRTDPDVAALRRAMDTMQQGWWDGQGVGWPRRPKGKHCIATALRHNEGVLRYFKVMHLLRGELGQGVRTWNDGHFSGQHVIQRLETIATKWEKQ